MLPAWLAAVAVLMAPLAGCVERSTDRGMASASDDGPATLVPGREGQSEATAEGPNGSSSFLPRVVVGLMDSGINPYHEAFFQPNRTAHPCTYVLGIPCSLSALDLSLGGSDYDAALRADRQLWESMEPDQWYWIPRTPFVAVSCPPVNTGLCALDDDRNPEDDRPTSAVGHGTAIASVLVQSSPDVSLAVRVGTDVSSFERGAIPVDIYSVSVANVAPTPYPRQAAAEYLNEVVRPLYFKAVGNYPHDVAVADGWSGSPEVLVVGGMLPEGNSDDSLAGKTMEFVAPSNARVASPRSTHETRFLSGTSLSTPAVAAGAAAALLELRQRSGYLGSVDGPFVDPISGITVRQFRDALNRTATYENANTTWQPFDFSRVPILGPAPWIQWGWGYYDASLAQRTVDHLLGVREAPPKPAAAVLYMESLYAARVALYDDM